MNKLKTLLQHWIVSIRLFPISHLIFVYLSVVGMYAVFSHSLVFDELRNLLLAGGLALIWSLMGPMLALHAPKMARVKTLSSALQIFSLLIGAGMYLWLGQVFELGEVNFWAYQVIGIFLVSFLLLFLLQARIYKKREAWLHIAISEFVSSLAFWGLAALIVFAGIAGTFASLEALFDVDIRSNVYECLAVFCSAFLLGTFALNSYSFNVQEFLTHRKPDQTLHSSRLARIFGLYIFLPLTMVYLAIFLAYGLKILITGNRPRGVIIGMGVAYVLGALFTYYLTYFQQGKWIERLRQLLFASFLGIGALMAGAIVMRVQQYGITIDRYLVMAFVLFVFLSAGGVLMWKEKRMLILISLFTLFAAVSFFWPLSATNVAWHSQKIKLEALLLKQNIYLPLGSGSLEKVVDEDRQIESILRYLIGNYSRKQLHNGLFEKEITCENYDWYLQYKCFWYIKGLLSLNNPELPYDEHSRYFSFYAHLNDISLEGYKTLYTIGTHNYKDGVLRLSFQGREVEVEFASHFPILEQKYKANKSFVYEIMQGDLKILLTDFSFTKRNSGRYDLESLAGYILTK